MQVCQVLLLCSTRPSNTPPWDPPLPKMTVLSAWPLPPEVLGALGGRDCQVIRKADLRSLSGFPMPLGRFQAWRNSNLGTP